MHKILYFLLFIPAMLYSQGNADCKLSNPFNSIQVYDGIIVTLERGEVEKLCPAAGTKLNELNITLEDSVLRIRKIPGNDYKSSPALRIYYKELVSIEGSGKADMDTRNLITSDSIKIVLRSGAKMLAEMDVKLLDAFVMEGATLTCKGYAVEQLIHSTTKGMISAFELEGSTGKLKVSTGGRAKVSIEKTLSGTVTTGGFVNYKLNPAITVKTNLGGKLTNYSE